MYEIHFAVDVAEQRKRTTTSIPVSVCSTMSLCIVDSAAGAVAVDSDARRSQMEIEAIDWQS